MHRNIIFRDLTAPDGALSALHTKDEAKLRVWMTEQQKR